MSQPQSNNAKAVEESFFNSNQGSGAFEHSRNAGFSRSQTSQLIRQARLMKRAAAKRRQRETAAKQGKTNVDETQESELGDVIGNLEGER